MPAGTLRMWERRHGFPAPARLPGGHRRYTEHDVELVREVARLREQGLSMSAAIGRARRAAKPAPASVFANLRECHPELAPAVLSKRAMLVITHAIEDEYCARGSSGLLLACFQRERFYRQAERRWRELARTARFAVALADFAQLREPAGAAAEVPIPGGQPLLREWTLVVDDRAGQACLAAWELADQSELPDRRRSFEVLWSFEPEVVRSASELALEVLRLGAPGLAERGLAALADPVAAAAQLRFASALAHRMVGYLGTMHA